MADLQQQFVCVRILQMNDVDIALFQFDFDLTWMGFFLNADNRIYSRYGGRDAKSDEGRVSLQGLKTTMRHVLDRHRASAGEKPPPPHQPKLAHTVYKGKDNACMHCHEVWEGTRDLQRAAGTFDPESLYVYPLPENIGVTLDVHAGNRVAKVLPDSPASKAGLVAGDELQRMAGVDILAQGDVLWALHNAPAKGKLTVEFRRAGKKMSVELELAPGWRITDLNWRQSIFRELKYLKSKR